MRWLNFLRFGINTAIRFAIFVFPVSWVAEWADVTPSWKLAVFVAFLLIWSDIVIGAKDRSAAQDDPPVTEKPKRTVTPLTRAEVAFEARKLTREPRDDNANWV
jgi:hypothetical protein